MPIVHVSSSTRLWFCLTFSLCQDVCTLVRYPWITAFTKKLDVKAAIIEECIHYVQEMSNVAGRKHLQIGHIDVIEAVDAAHLRQNPLRWLYTGISFPYWGASYSLMGILFVFNSTIETNLMKRHWNSFLFVFFLPMLGILGYLNMAFAVSFDICLNFLPVLFKWCFIFLLMIITTKWDHELNSGMHWFDCIALFLTVVLHIQWMQEV